VAADAWDLDVQDYAMRADLWPLDPEGEMILAVQIETAEGIDNLAEILAVPGVGAAFIGPADLHADMGHLGQTGVEEVEALMEEALATAQEAGVPIGLTPAGRTIEERVEQGFTFNTR
jgi:4-hydroxy-2-oxoheptanedioate aldolase